MTVWPRWYERPARRWSTRPNTPDPITSTSTPRRAARRTRVDPRPDGAPWWVGEDPQRPRRGDRGAAVDDVAGARRGECAMKSALTVVLVDDHQMFRTGVRSELGGSITIVGEAEDVDSAVAVILDKAPDVVLLDVHLPGGGGG